MILIPAIDLMSGKCVRLVKGQKGDIINYPENPLELAEKYTSEGAGLLHIVDLDGAFTGEMKNIGLIAQLAKRFPVQVGGGIRDEAKIATLFEIGVSKVVLSTMLLGNQLSLVGLKEKYYGKLIGSFDFKGGKLSYAGWTKQSRLSFGEVANGLSEVVITDTQLDGTLSGPNLSLVSSIKESCNAKIIYAGGVGCLGDLVALKRAGAYGAIMGRSLLESKFTLKAALSAVNSR